MKFVLVIISMTIKFENFDHDNILIDEISCKTLIGDKLLLIRFNKIDGFIRV